MKTFTDREFEKWLSKDENMEISLRFASALFHGDGKIKVVLGSYFRNHSAWTEEDGRIYTCFFVPGTIPCQQIELVIEDGYLKENKRVILGDYDTQLHIEIKKELIPLLLKNVIELERTEHLK